MPDIDASAVSQVSTEEGFLIYAFMEPGRATKSLTPSGVECNHLSLCGTEKALVVWAPTREVTDLIFDYLVQLCHFTSVAIKDATWKPLSYVEELRNADHSMFDLTYADRQHLGELRSSLFISSSFSKSKRM